LKYLYANVASINDLLLCRLEQMPQCAYRVPYLGGIWSALRVMCQPVIGTHRRQYLVQLMIPMPCEQDGMFGLGEI